MDDLISRQAAIDAGKSYWKNEVDRIPKKSTDFDVFTQFTQICDSILIHNANICKAIDKLPPVQPGRKKGEWIDYTDEGYVECPFCHSATNCDGNKDELHFCFSCGADLRGEQDE